MRLTPLDIENQRFHGGFRGYKQEEVDAFLEKLLEDYTSLFNENQEYKNKLTKMEAQLEEYRTLKDAIERSVTLAQKMADETLTQAQSKASLIVERAGQEAERLLKEGKGKADSVYQELAELERRKTQFMMEFRLLLETQMRLLEGNGSGKIVETR